MFTDSVQTIIPHQQLTGKVHQRPVERPSKIVRTAMADN
jgi:hypothetical protein